jgi:hypothetical protein
MLKYAYRRKIPSQILMTLVMKTSLIKKDYMYNLGIYFTYLVKQFITNYQRSSTHQIINNKINTLKKSELDFVNFLIRFTRSIKNKRRENLKEIVQ